MANIVSSIVYLPDVHVALKPLVAVLPLRKSSREIASRFTLSPELFLVEVRTITAAITAAIATAATIAPSIHSFRFHHWPLLIINP